METIPWHIIMKDTYETPILKLQSLNYNIAARSKN